MDDDDIVLVHLSDIHLRKIESPYDLDEELRNQLELDADRLRKKLSHFDGIVVTGDIAYSGKEDEYDIARDWLKRLSLLLRSEEHNVWVVPGNHDVLHEVIDKSKTLRTSHKELRTIPEAEVDKSLYEYLTSSDSQKLIFDPIKEFNSFAMKYGLPAIDHSRLFWEDNLELNDGSILRLRGLNSTLISDSNDNLSKQQILSSYQRKFLVEPGVTYMSLCHHPPTWLREAEQDEFEVCLTKRVAIQLFGHKHRQRILQLDGTLRLSAGAVHPSRTEQNWEPRYNCLAIRVITEGENRILMVRVWARTWDREKRSFTAHMDGNGREYHEFRLPLGAWTRTDVKPRVDPSPKTERTTSGKGESEMSPRNVEQIQMDAKRKLIYRYFNLPYHQIIEVALALALLRDEDKNIDKNELYRRLIERAEATNKMGALWDRVNSYTKEGLPNPFKPTE